MALITVKFYGLWQLYLEVNSLGIEADDVDQALTRLEEKFNTQLQMAQHDSLNMGGRLRGNSVVLLNGINLRNLKETRLKKGDILQIFPPIAGG